MMKNKGPIITMNLRADPCILVWCQLKKKGKRIGEGGIPNLTIFSKFYRDTLFTAEPEIKSKHIGCT